MNDYKPKISIAEHIHNVPNDKCIDREQLSKLVKQFKELAERKGIVICTANYYPSNNTPEPTMLDLSIEECREPVKITYHKVRKNVPNHILKL